MTDSKSKDNFYFHYNLKQEGSESFNWPVMENDFEDFRGSNTFHLSKMNNKSQFAEFNPLSINPDINSELPAIPATTDNQNNINDQIDPSARVNSSFPLFNEKLLANSNAGSEIGINQMKTPYPSIMMPGLNKLQNYQAPVNFYTLNTNALRRPLPQELLEEEPVYVNPKQYERIMKLRIKKAQRGMVKSSVMPLERPKDKSYKHLSRHLHAKRRERGTGGRFLSKKEAEKKKLTDPADQSEIDQGLGSANLSDQNEFITVKRDQNNDQ